MQNVSESRPCPICGKTDWCQWDVVRAEVKTDLSSPAKVVESLMVVCKRVDKDGCPGSMVINAADGGQWQKLGFTKQGYVRAMHPAMSVLRRHAYQQQQSDYHFPRDKGVLSDLIVAVETGTSAMIDGSFKYMSERSAYKREGFPERADADRIDTVYRAFLDILVLEDWHKEKLNEEFGERLIRRGILERGLYRSLPPIKTIKGQKNLNRFDIMRRLISKVGEPVGVPGFFQKEAWDKSLYWTMTGTSGLLLPTFDIKGRVSGLRIRDDNPEYVDANGNKKKTGKYKWFSASKEIYDDEKKICINKYLNGTNLPAKYSLACSDNDALVMGLIEGEKKALVSNMSLSITMVSVPGVGSWATIFDATEGTNQRSLFTWALEKGYRVFIIYYDADMETNIHVQDAERDLAYNLKIQAKKRGIEIQVYLGRWDISLGKGLDDVIKNGNQGQVRMIPFDARMQAYWRERKERNNHKETSG